MTDVGDDVPTFTATVVDGEIEPFDLSECLGDEPVVLAFFPAAFSNTCTNEMEALRDEFDRDGCTLLGVSTDLPHALAEYRTRYELPFALVADPDHRAIEAYDAIADFERYGVDTVARRAVFVVAPDETVAYRWLADHPGEEPDYDALQAAVEVASE
ncbi:redoxin domain-containing protein [Halorubrum sp. CBA1125]|uniref:redoxin domain-containing protein n=1 Tax=Halorubrum sp. CBA1125 TaxID=2668072 RepID=UPI0012E92877|nr:redoxin domain-containing protein [Halorubrum sp. CBA1125]MUW14574.1 redoxin domain-containing protein [Halorubrum sp. CBA1125]